MKLAQLDNCKICGELFLKDHSDHCLSCYSNIERDFKRVADFLRISQNRYANLEDISMAVDVPVKQIMDFIRGGRIFAEDYPNLGYGCAQCGTLIKRQVLCSSCFEQYSTAIQEMIMREKATDELKKKQQDNEVQYWRLKKRM